MSNDRSQICIDPHPDRNGGQVWQRAGDEHELIARGLRNLALLLALSPQHLKVDTAGKNRLDLSHLPEGMYIVVFNTDQERISKVVYKE